MFIRSVVEDRTTHMYTIPDKGYFREVESGLTTLNAIVQISIQSEEELERLQSLIGETIDIEVL